MTKSKGHSQNTSTGRPRGMRLGEPIGAANVAPPLEAEQEPFNYFGMVVLSGVMFTDLVPKSCTNGQPRGVPFGSLFQYVSALFRKGVFEGSVARFGSLVDPYGLFLIFVVSILA